jgi:peptide deformylase
VDILEDIEKMSIIEEPNECLREKSKIIHYITSDIKAFAEEMKKIVKEKEGLGLAAPQLGRNIRLMVGYFFSGTLTALVNPRIVRREHQRVIFREGCLSCPGKEVDISRPEVIMIVAENLEGDKIVKKLSGVTARIFQHELDHLDGKLIIDYDKSTDENVS